MTTSPTVTARAVWTLALRIEGVGTPDGQYRLSMAPPPSWDTDGLYHECLDSWPDEIGAEVDFLTGETRQTAGNFSVRQTSTTRAAFWDTDPTVVARATAAVGATSTSIQTDTTTLAGTVIHWDREAILLGTHAGGGVYTGCTRGYLGTQATRHGDGELPDLELYQLPWSLKGRLVQVVEVLQSATGYGDEVVIWAGVLQDVEATGLARFKISCRDLLSLLGDVELGSPACRWIGSQSQQIRRPWGGYGSSSSTARCMVVEESSGFVGVAPYRVAPPGFGQGFWLQIEQIIAVGSYPTPPTDRAPAERTFREVISTHSAQPASSATPGDDTLPLSQQPAELVLQLLTTTRNQGIAGANGDWDTGIDFLAGGIPAIVVDEAQILAWGQRHAPFAVDNLFIGLSGPERLSGVLTKILRPLGAALVVRSGKLAVVQLADAPSFDVTSSLTSSQIITTGASQSRGLASQIDSVSVEYGLIPGVGSSSDRSDDVRQARRLPPGGRSSLSIDATAYAQAAVSRLSAVGMLFRYRLPPPRVTLDVLSSASYWPGDVVQITSSNLLGRAGAASVSTSALVLGRRLIFEGPAPGVGGRGSSILRYTLAVTGLIHRVQGLIGPSARVVSWNAGTKTITVAANVYTSASNPNLSTDAEGFFAADVVQIVDQYGTVVTAAATVASVGVNAIVLTAAPATAPVAGDVVRAAAWSSAVAAQRARWAFVADVSDELGGSVLNAYTYPVG